VHYSSSWRKSKIIGFILSVFPIPRSKQYNHDETKKNADGVV
jgi:hypothetical protein